MMKILLSLAATLATLLAFPQDWAFFQPGQRMYYHINSDTGMTVATQRLDSVRPSTNGDVHYFKLYNGPGQLEACWYENLQLFPLPNLPYNIFLMDSLLMRGDTVFGYAGPGYGPWYFLPQAAVGQSWTTPLVGGGPQETTFTCISNEQETFLGITDSVKTFSINATGSSAPPINDFLIKLSKGHGLIEFLPFGLTGPHSTLPVRTFKLIGLNDGAGDHGYVQPRFADYFHLSQGDILQWYQNYHPALITEPAWIGFHQDSITHALITPDSVVYTFHRTTLNEDLSLLGQASGLKATYRESEFRYMVGGLTDSYAMGATDMFTGPGSDMPVWQTGLLQLGIDPITGDTTTRMGFSSGGFYFDTINCYISTPTDLYSSLDLDSRVGVFGHCQSFNTSMDCSELIGWRINGVVTGDLKWTTSIRDIPADRITLRPNLVHDAFMIDGLPHGSRVKVEIFDLAGQLLLRSEWDGTPISVDGLGTGLYLLRLGLADGARTFRFVKE